MTLVPTYGVLPAMGYGTWKRKGDECLRCVTHALDVGYRHIDTAAIYENEREVGEAIRNSSVPRSDVFLATKVWHTSLDIGDVLASAEASLERLGMDYVDLLLVHWPSVNDAVPVGQYMEELVKVKEVGLVRNIGVSNFTIRHIDEAIAAVGAGQIATNQCELNVTFQNTPIVKHCNAVGIPMTAYLPLASGTATAGADLDRIAARHGATPAQIALAWLIARGHVAIPSSSDNNRIAENFAALNIALSGGDLIDLDRLDTGKRRVDADFAPAWDAYDAA